MLKTPRQARIKALRAACPGQLYLAVVPYWQAPLFPCTLQNLNLYGTGLTGFLPKEMSRLTTIQFISLGDNKLEGGWLLQTLVWLSIIRAACFAARVQPAGERQAGGWGRRPPQSGSAKCTPHDI